MTYRDAEKHLGERQMFGIKFGLTNIKRLLRRLGNPERSFRSVHIAGTNGKGSTAAMLSAMLSANGCRTGLYTSPHISTVRERFRIDEKMISRKDFARLYAQLIPHFDDIPMTYFECTTALAFLWFREQSADTAVIETGMGGRFDATTAVTPVCSVITTIGYDHMEYLGDRLTQITREKCGIIKKGVPVVSGVGQPLCANIIRATAERRHAEYIHRDSVIQIADTHYGLQGSAFDVIMNGDRLDNVCLPLPGTFQVDNARTAFAVMEVLRQRGMCINIKQSGAGLKNVFWPERFTIYRHKPLFIIDVAHNEPAFTALKQEILKLFPGKNVLLITGMKDEKDYGNALRPMLPLCKEAVGIPVQGARGADLTRLASCFHNYSIPFTSFLSVKKGVLYALKQAGRDDIVVCAGSHYTVDRIKKVINSLD
ncbi:bifunctional folylpolyglutamate synthase/dihydrofolate synthase [candidate division KSB1 bacterium]